MTVDNLEGGTKYYYQIEAVNGDATVTSEVLSFTKLSRTNDWQEFNTAVKDINPDAFLVGENWTDTATMAKYFEDLDSSFNFPLANKLLNMAYGNDVDILGDVKDIHNQYATYSNQFIDSTFLSNHDQPRVTFLLGDHEKSKLAASVLFTMPGTPFVYYGEEIGQVGHNLDGEFITANDSISVEEQSGEQESIFEHYKKLISIRKNNPALFTVDNYSKLSLSDSLYGYQVRGQNNLYVVHNNTADSYQVSIDSAATELLSDTSYSGGDTILLDDYNTVIEVVRKT
jgi:glycosidase